MQVFRRVLRAVPFPFLGYLMGLVGFVFLGTFVAALGAGSSIAPVLGGGMVVAFVAMGACFRIRSLQIARGDGEGADLSLDPMVPDADPGAAERYRMRYRQA